MRALTCARADGTLFHEVCCLDALVGNRIAVRASSEGGKAILGHSRHSSLRVR